MKIQCLEGRILNLVFEHTKKSKGAEHESSIPVASQKLL